MACASGFFECSSGTGGGCCPSFTACYASKCYFQNGTNWGGQLPSVAQGDDGSLNSFRGLAILLAVLFLFLVIFCWGVVRRAGFLCFASLTRRAPPPPMLILAELGAPHPPPPPPPLPAQELRPDPAQWRAVPVALPAAGSLGLLGVEAVEGKGCVVRSLTPNSPLAGLVQPGDRLLLVGEGEGAVNALAMPFDDIQALLAGAGRPPAAVFLRKAVAV